MGKLHLSQPLKLAALALLGFATAITVATLLSTPVAAAGGDGDGGVVAVKAWDTDNLRYYPYTARNFRVPFHNYGGYVDRAEAKPCVAQGRLTSSNFSGACVSPAVPLERVCSYGYIRYVSGVTSSATLYEIATSGMENSDCGSRYVTDAAVCWPGNFGNTICRQGSETVWGRVSGVSGIKICGRNSFWLHHNCGGSTAYVARPVHDACRGGIADAFFQTGGTATGGQKIVDDFPVLEYRDSWKLKTGSGLRNSGCVDFVSEQDRLTVSVSSTGSGYYLKTQNIAGSEAVLASTGSESLPARVTARPAADYVLWENKATAGYGSFGIRTGTSHSYYGPYSPSTGYADRVDTRTALAMASDLPSSSNLLFPWKTNSGAGLGSGQGSVSCTAGTRDACREYLPRWFPVVNTPYGSVGGYWEFRRQTEDMSAGSLFSTATKSSTTTAHMSEYYGDSRHLSAGQDSGGLWCPVGMHPRGQDALAVIGRSTGRTLSSLGSETGSKLADRYWCRSDVRYKQGFKAQDHGLATPSGVTVADADYFFEAYGRKNCYRTVIALNVNDGVAECVYRYPLPLCDPDPDNGSDSDWREFTAAEVANIGVVDEPLLVDEGAYCGTNINPPDLAGFDADACVEVTVAVYESRVASSNAEPGVPAADRTVAASDDVAVYDLDITAPHTKTASPPRDETVGSVDPSGCADGEEARSDHGSRARSTDAVLPAASAERKSSGAAANPANPQTVPYPLPSSSAASNTAAPPSDYDADNSYAGVRANLAHRYASQIAENTCSVKRAEA